jgi:hypothetical protein
MPIAIGQILDEIGPATAAGKPSVFLGGDQHCLLAAMGGDNDRLALSDGLVQADLLAVFGRGTFCMTRSPGIPDYTEIGWPG